MSSRSRFRLLAVIPALFSLAGMAILAMTYALRQFMSPWPRGAVGAIVVLSCILAFVALWRAHRRAPETLLIAGTCTLAAGLASGWLFPLVIASDEPPSFLARYYFRGALVLIVALTAGGVWSARVTRRALSDTR